MEELKFIMEKFVASGWDLVRLVRKSRAGNPLWTTGLRHKKSICGVQMSLKWNGMQLWVHF